MQVTIRFKKTEIPIQILLNFKGSGYTVIPLKKESGKLNPLTVLKALR